LKRINPFYRDIHLPESSADLMRQLPEVQVYDDDKDVDDVLPIGEPNLSPRDLASKRCVLEQSSFSEHNAPGQGAASKSNVMAQEKRESTKPALLTQVLHSDERYEHFTIYPINESRVNKTATSLYQMKKVQDVPLDSREKNLDLLCFPDLYPFGENGQRADRQAFLSDFEYIKLRMMSKHPQFRLNIQYFFFFFFFCMCV